MISLIRNLVPCSSPLDRLTTGTHGRRCWATSSSACGSPATARPSPARRPGARPARGRRWPAAPRAGCSRPGTIAVHVLGVDLLGQLGPPGPQRGRRVLRGERRHRRPPRTRADHRHPDVHGDGAYRSVPTTSAGRPPGGPERMCGVNGPIGTTCTRSSPGAATPIPGLWRSALSASGRSCDPWLGDGPAAVLVPVKAFRAAKVRLVAGPRRQPSAPTLARAWRRGWSARRRAAAGGGGLRRRRRSAPGPAAVGAQVLWRPGRGLNGAVEAGVADLAAQGFAQVIVAHADLPLASELAWLASYDGVTSSLIGTATAPTPAACRPPPGSASPTARARSLRHCRRGSATRARTAPRARPVAGVGRRPARRSRLTTTVEPAVCADHTP